MSTQQKTSEIHLKVSHKNQKPGTLGWFDNQVSLFEKGRFGWMAIYMTAQSCLGSITCMYILHNHGNDFQLAGCAAITMGSNAMFIAQTSGKLCLISFYVSLLLNILFILYNI
jgi:hypothetical protein